MVTTCLVSDCPRTPDGGRGWCNLHYLRWRKHGDPLATLLPRGLTPKGRLEAGCDRSGGPDACWPWLREIDRDGYGHVSIDRARHLAHRLAYELVYGAIPDETLDHACHTADTSCPGGRSCQHRRCVNPTHLTPMSRALNSMLGDGPCVRNAAKTHCDHGHAFDDANTYWTPQGHRSCRTCVRAAKARYLARQRSVRSVRV